MKHKLFITLTLLCLGTTSIAQVGIGTDNPNDAAILEIKSTDKGILLPRLESSKISSLDNVQGLMVYCTDCDDSKGVLKINNGSEWVNYIPASGGTIVNEDINPDAKIDGTKITSYFGTQDIMIRDGNNFSFLEGDLTHKLDNIFRQTSSADLVMASGYKFSNTANKFASSYPNLWAKSAIGVGFGRIVFYTDPPTTIAVGTDINPTERMRIDANGKVIIKGDLQVEGNFNNVPSTATIGTETVESDNIKNETIVNEDINPDAKIDGSKIVPDFGDQDISTNGNVGIGTKSPGLALDLRTDPSINWQMRIGSNDNNTSHLYDHYDIGRNTSDGYLYFDGKQSGHNGYVFGGADGERMRIDADGNVGIGMLGNSPLERSFNIYNNGNESVIKLFTEQSGIEKSDGLEFGIGADQHGFIWLEEASFIQFGTNNAERMRIDADGNVGIGTAAAAITKKFYVNGSAGGTSTWQLSSDERWKKEIKTLDNSLNKITALRGVSYEWNHDEFPDKNFSEGTQIGVIAQEIENVFPELVHTDKDGYKSVSYSNLVAPLIEAIKELKQQNENFRIRIESLEAQLKNQNN